VWDDHEFANNTWRDGAASQSENNEVIDLRRAAAGLSEWMPIREDRAARRAFNRISFKLPIHDARHPPG
jgi:alkaline phosphatase D